MNYETAYFRNDHERLLTMLSIAQEETGLRLVDVTATDPVSRRRWRMVVEVDGSDPPKILRNIVVANGAKKAIEGMSNYISGYRDSRRQRGDDPWEPSDHDSSDHRPTATPKDRDSPPKV